MKLYTHKLEMPACNERFHAMAAVASQKWRCDFGGFAPARSSVEAATA